MTTITDTDQLEAMFAAPAVPCMNCGKTADMIGTGHQHFPCPGPIEPPPPWFKCAACHLKWHSWIAEVIAADGVIACAHCDEIFETVDEFSYWRPV